MANREPAPSGTDFNNIQFEVEFTEQCIEEMTEIYEYIVLKLKESEAAKRLLSIANQKVLDLKVHPHLYVKISKVDKLKHEYHRIVVKNYVILYTVDKNNKNVYVSRMIYGKRNYLY